MRYHHTKQIGANHLVLVRKSYITYDMDEKESKSKVSERARVTSQRALVSRYKLARMC